MESKRNSVVLERNQSASISFLAAVTGIYLFTCLVTLGFIDLKMRALAFEGADYAYFLQFSARLFDQGLSKRISLNPEGYNFLGFTGVEAADHFHQSLHFEPVKYVYAVIYAILPFPMAIFTFITLVYFSPLLYLAWVHPSSSRSEALWVLLFCLSYALFPGSIHAPAHDLRPRTFLTPCVALATMAIVYRRPSLEKAVLFGLLLLAREEALALALPLIPLEALLGGRRRVVLFLSGAWLAALAGILAYFSWTGYEIDPGLQPLMALAQEPRLLIFIIIAGLLSLILAAALLVVLRRSGQGRSAVTLLVFSTILLPPAWQVVRDESFWFSGAPFHDVLQRTLDDFFRSSELTLVFTLGLLVLLVARRCLYSPIFVQKLNRSFAVMLLGCALIAFFALPPVVAGYRERALSAAIVFELRQKTDRYTTYILADYTTHQAFYDYERVYAYNRLPWHILKRRFRYFPENTPALERMIERNVEWVAVERASAVDLIPLLEEVGISPVERVENDQFLVVKLR